MTRRLMTSFFAGAALALAGCQAQKRPAPPASAPGSQVVIDNFSFVPAELTVHAGDLVTWLNRDDVPHTIVSTRPDRTLKSDALDTDDTYHFRFTAPGSYAYFCGIHPHMTGRIVVLPAERNQP